MPRQIRRQHTVNEIEDRRLAGTPARLRQTDRPIDVTPVIGAAAALRHIGAVYRKRRDNLFERREHGLEGKIAGPPIAHRQTVEAAGEHVHLACQIDLHDPLLRCVQHLVKIFALSGQPAIKPGHCSLGVGIDKQRQYLVGKVVAGAAVDRPIRQPLVAREDLLNKDVERLAASLAQRRAIGGGVEQPVDMVDTQPVDLSMIDHVEHQPVGCIEQLGQFDAQPGQIVDVEKPAVVDLLGGNAPVGDPISLLLQQPMQTAKARRPSRGPGEGLHRRRDRVGKCRVLRGHTAFQFGRTAARRFRFEPPQRRELALKIGQCGPGPSQDDGIGMRRDRKTVVVVPGAEAALVRVETQRDLASLQHRAVLVAEHREQHPAFQILAQRIPVDVKIGGVR